jgi:sugar phosphate isomerase/epimerase
MNTPSTSMNRRQFLQSSSAIGTLAAAGMSSAIRPLQADEPAKTEGWQLGCFTRPFADFPYAETLDAIAAAGYAAVGLMSARLAIAVTYYGGPSANESPEGRVAALRRLIDNCGSAKCATILLGGTPKEEFFDAYYGAVKSVCDYAAERKVAFVLKPHGGLNATGAQIRDIVRAVGHPAFRVWYDPGNIFYYSEGKSDPLDDVASVAGLVIGMCVKDFKLPREVALNPGTGLVNFPELMKRLAAGGFRSGPLIVETLDPGDLPATTANARKAREFLQSILS